MTNEEILEQFMAERQPVECWTRVMGYFRPVSQFNKGKKSEFAERQWFLEECCTCHMQQQDMQKVG